MSHSHWPRFAALSLLSFAILFQYQNCAPGGKQISAASAASDDNNNIVVAMGTSAVAATAAQAVQMTSAVVRLAANQNEASVTGSCVASEAQTLNWNLRDPETGEDLAEGTTACVNNAFNMELASNQKIECNRVYDLQVDGAEATVTKDCQN